MRVFFPFLLLFLLSSCGKSLFDGPNTYADGFESYTSLSEMISDSNKQWSFTQLTFPGNFISIVTDSPHSGSQCVRFSASPSSPEIVSKCSLNKHKMAFWEGETVFVSAWYKIESSEVLDWIFLMDLEEQTAIGAGPGMRLALEKGRLVVEHKYWEKDLYQDPANAIPFPLGQWVHVEWELKLSQSHEGEVRVWQNGALLISSKNHRTLPIDFLYFQQGTKGMYSSIEIGITANTRHGPVVLYVDDFQIGVR